MMRSLKQLRKARLGSRIRADHRLSLFIPGVFFVVLVLVELLSGCRVVQTAADLPGQAVGVFVPGKKEAVNPVDIQQDLFRFADEFSTQMTLGVDRLKRGTNALSQAEVLRAKIGIVSDTIAIASGPNPLANLLDMTISVTMTRMAAEAHAAGVFGDSITPMLESCRASESNIWQIAGRAMGPDQLSELREAIMEWHRQNPYRESAVGMRGVGLLAELKKPKEADTGQSESVFSLLKVDPLSGLDPAMKELAQTRLFGERVFFMGQKLPQLLRWQSELLAIHTMDIPAVRQIVTNSTQITATLERFASVAEQLPAQVSQEREEILKALVSQEAEVTNLLGSATQTSDSLNITLTTLDGLMERFGVGDTNQTAAATNAEPFRIQDYTETADEIEAAAHQLTELVLALNQTLAPTNVAQLSAQVGPVVDKAKADSKEIVDHVFWRAVWLVVIILAAGLLYRFLRTGLSRKDEQSSKTSA